MTASVSFFFFFTDLLRQVLADLRALVLVGDHKDSRWLAVILATISLILVLVGGVLALGFGRRFHNSYPNGIGEGFNKCEMVGRVV